MSSLSSPSSAQRTTPRNRRVVCRCKSRHEPYGDAPPRNWSAREDTPLSGWHLDGKLVAHRALGGARCGMCLAKLRYEHRVRHPLMARPMTVGCLCAQRLLEMSRAAVLAALDGDWQQQPGRRCWRKGFAANSVCALNFIANRAVQLSVFVNSHGAIRAAWQCVGDGDAWNELSDDTFPTALEVAQAAGVLPQHDEEF